MTLTRCQRTLLRQLAAADGFTPVSKHECVLRRLLKRDLVFTTTHATTGERLWKITERGRKLVTPKYRQDGLCPRCQKNKRTKYGYCVACKATYQRENRIHHRTNKRCARCHEAQRQIYKSGRQSCYCAACNVVNARETDARRQAGRKVTMCPMCRVLPRHVQTNGVIRSYCEECEYKRGKRRRLAKAKVIYGRA